MLIKRWIFYDSDGIEITPPSYRSFLTIWYVFGGLYTQAFYSWAYGAGVKGDSN